MPPRSRILPVVGPAVAVYLAAVAAAEAPLEGLRGLALVLGLVLCLTPLWTRGMDATGTRRVRQLGIISGVIVAAHLLADRHGPLRVGVLAFAETFAGLRLFQLALVVPDRPGRLRRLGILGALGGVAAALIGLLGAFPPSE